MNFANLSDEDLAFIRSMAFNPRALVVGSAQRRAAELLQRLAANVMSLNEVADLARKIDEADEALNAVDTDSSG